MAVVEPYSPCPCGSGEKFKWCCQKVEAYADRAQRLYENGQIEAALDALEEGLRKFPDNAWLLIRKSMSLCGAGKFEPAKALLKTVLKQTPGHVGAQSLLIRVVLETEGSPAGAAQLQQALGAVPAERRATMALMTQFVAVELTDAQHYPAALAHLYLAVQLGTPTDRQQPIRQTLQWIESSISISPWLKNPYTLSPAPAGLKPRLSERFQQALGWEDEGLWASAASAFETLSADGAGIEADRNCGICRLWIADDAGAVAALRRYLAKAGETDDAVDLEQLCQELTPVGPDDQVERVQLIWPVRNRDALIAALGRERTIFSDGPGPLDPEDENSPEADLFTVLDRPPIERTQALKPGDIPRIVGQVFVGQQIVALEAYDDEQLGRLSDRFTTLAGPAIAPAHPRTKVMGVVSRSSLALVTSWMLPEGLTQLDQERLAREERDRMLREVWPNTPESFLGGRTPLQAARDGDARVPLRAVMLRRDINSESPINDIEQTGVRERLGLKPEPELDPDTVDIERLHLSRLHLVPADRLTDERLLALYQRAQRMSLSAATQRAARALIDRPALFADKVSVVSVYSDLAAAAAARGDLAECQSWFQRGRQAEPPAQRARNAPSWDIIDIEFRSAREEPETWVPDLAVIMERYREDPAGNQTIFRHLLGMGLLQMMPNPDDRKTMLLDTRRLQALMTEYGPKVTTASGRLGVSATKGGIWTPGSDTGGAAGGLWTPGGETGSAAAAGDKPKLIIPGR